MLPCKLQAVRRWTWQFVRAIRSFCSKSFQRTFPLACRRCSGVDLNNRRSTVPWVRLRSWVRKSAIARGRPVVQHATGVPLDIRRQWVDAEVVLENFFISFPERLRNGVRFGSAGPDAENEGHQCQRNQHQDEDHVSDSVLVFAVRTLRIIQRLAVRNGKSIVSSIVRSRGGGDWGKQSAGLGAFTIPRSQRHSRWRHNA
jgi:hypothetical protein